MIGVDWGTSNMRAFRLRDGVVVGRAEGGPGVLQVAAGGFGAALRGLVGEWLAAGETRVLMGGMVGSRQGWVEAAYLPCPADLAGLAAGVVAVAFAEASVRIVPGVSARDRAGVPEVMRGEEVQLAGVMGGLPRQAAVCLPGTHSKWVRVEDGVIAGFETHMTGEVFAALRGHTILGRLMAAHGAGVQDGGVRDGAAFARGVARAGDAGGLLHHLFGVRTLALLGELGEAEGASFLSGLLIGHEIRQATRAGAPEGPPEGTVHLVGTPGLCALYQAGLRQIGVDAVLADADAAARGLARIGEHVDWGSRLA